MRRFSVVLFIILFSITVSSQSVFGKWKTIDGQSGEEKSIVEIYKENGKLFGKIIDILNPNDKNALCKRCKDEDFNKPVLGLVLIKNMQKDGSYYRKGTILHPEHGKTFRCRLKLTDNPDVLQVRGYVSFLYSTQYWIREK